MIPSSELIINEDGSIFHLHLRPEQLAHKVILVGDPGRVSTIAAHFDSQEAEVESREFHTITGSYRGERISVVSTGIGCDNIDIVLTELDALVNIDFNTREVKQTLTQLEIVRLGTCGGLQDYTPVGTFIASQKSIGFDGLLNFYAYRDRVCDLDMEDDFLHYMRWKQPLCLPYVINADPSLLDRIAQEDMVRGITIACNGFYGPQGRRLRLPLADPEQNSKVEEYEYQGLRITNYEMESSAVAGMSAMLGHKAMTCCMVVAGRRTGEADTSYKNNIDTLIIKVLDRI